jgi:signal transduction histidine kinase
VIAVHAPGSVRARAAVAAGLAGAVLFVAGAVWMRHVVRDAAMRTATLRTEQLAEKVDSVVAHWRPFPAVEGDASFELNGRLTARYDAGNGFGLSIVDLSADYAFEVVGKDGRVISSTALLRRYERGRPVLPTPPHSAVHDGRIWQRSARLGGRTYRVVTRNVNLLDESTVKANEPPVGRLYLFVPAGDADRAVAGVDRVLLPAIPLAVLLVALVAWVVTGRSVRAVERVRAEAAARQRRFVADAAHELRSPIGSIRAILDVALADPDGPGRSAVRDARAEARRLHRLADDLLLLSRLESGGPPAADPVDLTALARDQVADRGRLGPVTVTLDTRPVPVVRGDPAQLDRLLANLLDNAERYARGAVTVTVGTGPDGGAVVAVTDDGPGVPEPDRDRVFDRFTRLDEARDRGAGGAGLGLAIARDICTRHGGTLTVTAAAGGGARFEVRLPAAG